MLFIVTLNLFQGPFVILHHLVRDMMDAETSSA